MKIVKKKNSMFIKGKFINWGYSFQSKIFLSNLEKIIFILK